ncbi:MAG: hypothetical protein QXK74_08575 [Candidatus Nitrosocaldaceae archaeon]
MVQNGRMRNLEDIFGDRLYSYHQQQEQQQKREGRKSAIQGLERV